MAPKRDFLALFSKLKSKHGFQPINSMEVPKKNFPSEKQRILFDFARCKAFAKPLVFQNARLVQQYIMEWVEKKKVFSSNFGIDPCPSHCKQLFDVYNIE